jgi:adenylate cyclase
MPQPFESGAHRTWLGGSLLRAGNPLDWPLADRLFLGCAAVLPFTLFWFVIELRALADPAFAPYFDRSFLPIATWVQVVLVAGWGVLTVLAWRRRGSDDASWLAAAVVAFYFGGFGTASYYIGHFTSPFGAAVGLAGATVVALLFGLRLALMGLALFVAIILGSTVAEQAGLVAYAPLMINAVFDQDPMVRDYLLVGAIPITGVFAAGALLSYYTIARWHDREEKLAQANQIISRYVASQLVAGIRAGRYDSLARQERRRLTLFFSDIEGFAATADLTEPEDLAAVLNEYLAEMTEIGHRYGATIDKFVGDAIMIFFGAPDATDDRDHALRAVRMALEMQQQMTVLQDRWRRQGFERPFRIRIGINTGQASIGNFGSSERMDYTAIGRQVNLAARLQAHCEPGSVLVSRSTWVLIQDDVRCTEKGTIEVKGFHQPIAVYEVDGALGGNDEARA